MPRREADLRELLAVPANYKVLFLQGGAIAENAIVPMNLLRGRSVRRLRQHRRVVEKIDQGSEEVLQREHRRLERGQEFHLYPAAVEAGSWPRTRRYVHICSNETIGGVEYHWVPDTGDVPLVADMSSHILSRPVDVAKYGLIYAGAQKNIGPAGLTRGDRARRPDRPGRAVHALGFRLQDAGRQRFDVQHAAHLSRIYIAGLVFKWLKAQGGLAAMERRNIAKAKLLYGYLDQSTILRQPGASGATARA